MKTYSLLDEDAQMETAKNSQGSSFAYTVSQILKATVLLSTGIVAAYLVLRWMMEEATKNPVQETKISLPIDKRNAVMRRDTSSNNWPSRMSILNTNTAGQQIQPAIAFANGTMGVVFVSNTINPGIKNVAYNVQTLTGNFISQDKLCYQSSTVQQFPSIISSPSGTLLLDGTIASQNIYTAISGVTSTTGAGCQFNTSGIVTTHISGSGFSPALTNVGTSVILFSAYGLITSPERFSAVAMNSAQSAVFLGGSDFIQQAKPSVAFNNNNSNGVVVWVNGTSLAAQDLPSNLFNVFYPEYNPDNTSSNAVSNPKCAVGENGEKIIVWQGAANSYLRIKQTNGIFTSTRQLGNGLALPQVATIGNTVVTMAVSANGTWYGQLFNLTTANPLAGIPGNPFIINLDPVTNNILPTVGNGINATGFLTNYIFPGAEDAPIVIAAFSANTTGTSLQASMGGNDFDIVSVMGGTQPWTLMQWVSSQLQLFAVPQLYQNSNITTNFTITFIPPGTGQVNLFPTINFIGNISWINNQLQTAEITWGIQITDIVTTNCDNSGMPCYILTIPVIPMTTPTPTATASATASATATATVSATASATATATASATASATPTATATATASRTLTIAPSPTPSLPIPSGTFTIAPTLSASPTPITTGSSSGIELPPYLWTLVGLCTGSIFASITIYSIKTRQEEALLRAKNNTFGNELFINFQKSNPDFLNWNLLFFLPMGHYLSTFGSKFENILAILEREYYEKFQIAITLTTQKIEKYLQLTVPSSSNQAAFLSLSPEQQKTLAKHLSVIISDILKRKGQPLTVFNLTEEVLQNSIDIYVSFISAASSFTASLEKAGIDKQLVVEFNALEKMISCLQQELDKDLGRSVFLNTPVPQDSLETNFQSFLRSKGIILEGGSRQSMVDGIQCLAAVVDGRPLSRISNAEEKEGLVFALVTSGSPFTSAPSVTDLPLSPLPTRRTAPPPPTARFNNALV